MFKKLDRKLSGDHNQCAACGEYFNSTAAFDKHRTGDFGTPDHLDANRRCFAVQEMLAHGMAVSSTGWWITSARDYE